MIALAATVVSCVGFAPSAAAAGGRHFEQVSPAEKGQSDVVGDGETTVASRSGDAVAFNSRAPFGDTEGSGVSGQSQFVARRDAGGWSTHAITPMPRPDAWQVFFAATKLQTYSDDLRSAIVWAYDLPGASDDAPLRNSIYAEDTATRALETITVSQQDPLMPGDFLNQVELGTSADARHLAFVTPTQMLPNAAPGAPNIYQWDDGRLSLAGILPDGTVPPSGSDAPVENYRGAMSADGSRLVFVASPNGGPLQLYMRIDGTRTVLISQPEHRINPSDNNFDPEGVLLQAITPDGHNVFFVTDSRLLDADDNDGPDLYRYTDSPDPVSDDNLTMISQHGDVPGSFLGTSVVGFSDDGQRVYYQTSSNDLAVWDHGTTRLVSRSVFRDATEGLRLAVTASDPGLGRVSADGMLVAFATTATPSQDGVHDLTGQFVTNGHMEMYVYWLRDGSLLCVSCPSGPASSDVSVSPGATDASVTLRNAAFRPRFLSEDGRVFFSSGEQLVPEDVNGVVDTYEYDANTRTLSLVSSGRGRDVATFADASASGDDVFLVTRQRLAASDHDNLVDLYDARIGSSLPEPPGGVAVPCEGEGCQPPPSAAPVKSTVGSLTFSEDAGGVFGSGSLTVRHRVTFHGASGSLGVRIPGAGRLSWSGRGVRAGSVRRSKGGSYVVRLRLGRGARARLRASGSYTTTVRLAFVSASGDEVRASTRVTFRAVARKGR